MSKKAKLKALKEKETAIKNNMEILGLSREEAEELWKFDNEEIENEFVNEIEAKEEIEKQKKKKTASPIAKVKTMKAKKKADAEKQEILDAIFKFAAESDLVINLQNLAANKVVFRGKDGGYYTMSITKNKSCPVGYADCVENS